MGLARMIWMYSGIVLFICGMIFKNVYTFIGGMFLMIIVLISKFGDGN